MNNTLQASVISAVAQTLKSVSAATQKQQIFSIRFSIEKSKLFLVVVQLFGTFSRSSSCISDRRQQQVKTSRGFSSPVVRGLQLPVEAQRLPAPFELPPHPQPRRVLHPAELVPILVLDAKPDCGSDSRRGLLRRIPGPVRFRTGTNRLLRVHAGETHPARQHFARKRRLFRFSLLFPLC